MADGDALGGLPDDLGVQLLDVGFEPGEQRVVVEVLGVGGVRGGDQQQTASFSRRAGAMPQRPGCVRSAAVDRALVTSERRSRHLRPGVGPVAGTLLDDDPILGFEQDDDGRWWIRDNLTGQRHGSPSDEAPWPQSDIGYVGRRRRNHGTVLHIAGIHTYGSVAAARHVTTALDELYRLGDEASFSMVVAGTFDGLTPTGVGVLVPARPWDDE